MSEHTLTVSGRFAEDFRSAIVQEIAFDTRYIETTETDSAAPAVVSQRGTPFRLFGLVIGAMP